MIKVIKDTLFQERQQYTQMTTPNMYKIYLFKNKA